MTRQAHIKKLKEAVEQGKHPMQQTTAKRQKRAEKVAEKIIALAEKG